MRRRVAMVVVGVLALVGAAMGRAEAQGAPPVAVTLSVLAGGQRFAFAPGTTGEAAVELPAGTPALLSAAIEGNLTALGPYRLNIGPATGRGIAIGCNTPCTTTQVRVDGRNGDDFAVRAVVLGGSGQQVAASPVVRISWGRVSGAAQDAERAVASPAADPVRVGVVLVIGVLLAAAVMPLSLPKRS
ncbi:MAG: hypothetical protein WC211_07350 [Dehalococcoidia bacterium]